MGEDSRARTHTSGDPATRADVLRLYDVSMLSNAPNYDLRQRAERRRSALDLADLFFHAVKAAQPDLFVEAGAKDARASRRARRHLTEARIVAFEANPYVYERYRAENQQAERRIEYVPLALSDKPGTATLYLRKDSQGRPRVDGKASLKEIIEHEHGLEEVSVEATTLDSFFASSYFSSCALWIDVEGASEEVLRGGHQVLAKTTVALVETEDRGVWAWGRTWTATDVCGYFLDQGLIPIARDYQSRYQYNVLFVAPPLLRHHDLRLQLANHRSGALRTSRTPDTADTATSPRLGDRVSRALHRVARRLRHAAPLP